MTIASRIVATLFGIGLFPYAPGTVASAVGVLAYKLALHDLAWPLYLALIGVIFVAGTAASAAYATALDRPDPGRIVIDEVCGQLIACALLPGDWATVATSFALFRFFDIIKPWPIRRLEKIPGGWGIMADDLGAGLAAAALVHLGRLLL